MKTAEWLTERYNVDIRCYRLSLAKGGNEVFLTCTRAYPPPELTELSIRRRRKKEVGGEETTDWDEALGSVKNSAVVAFFRQELAEGRSNNPKYKALRFYIGDRRRFVVQAKQEWARVWQGARFDDDIEFWKSRLGERARIKPMRGGQRLRFHLADEADFSKFKKAAAAELMTVEFNDHGDESTDEPGNEAE